ncbi:MAG: hypothetical protein ACOCVY_00245 [Patescibacteria group bacterium]
MRIEQKLPQFSDQKTLIIVTGRQEAVAYIALNGEIKEKERLEVEDPGYSDREGFFMSSGGTAGTYKAGSVYKENITQNLTKQFLNQLQEKVKNLVKKEKAETIYLFCPDYMKKEIMSKFPKALKKDIQTIRSGNYIGSHPFVLLEYIKKEGEKKKEKTVTPIKEKAMKILKKTTRFSNKDQ